MTGQQLPAGANGGIPTWVLVVTLAGVLFSSVVLVGFIVVFMDTIACDSGRPECLTASTRALYSWLAITTIGPIAAFVWGLVSKPSTSAGRRNRTIALILMIVLPFVAFVVNFVVLLTGAPSAA